MGLESLCEVFCVYLPQVYTSPEGGGSMAVKMLVPSYQMPQYYILEFQLCSSNYNKNAIFLSAFLHGIIHTSGTLLILHYELQIWMTSPLKNHYSVKAQRIF
jgi:hypothetical protein